MIFTSVGTKAERMPDFRFVLRRPSGREAGFPTDNGDSSGGTEARSLDAAADLKCDSERRMAPGIELPASGAATVINGSECCAETLFGAAVQKTKSFTSLMRSNVVFIATATKSYRSVGSKILLVSVG